MTARKRMAPYILLAVTMMMNDNMTIKIAQANGFSVSNHKTYNGIGRHDHEACSLSKIQPSAPIKSNDLPKLSATSSIKKNEEISEKENGLLPSSVTPILFTVLALILSEGIAISTIPLHLTSSLGASPIQVGLATSAFSIAQMVCCPMLISLSNRPNIGRRQTLKLCLLGAGLSSICIAMSTTTRQIIAARFLAGIFAAAIPIAQAGVTDLVAPHQQALALSRVSAASQLGIVIGPAVSAMVQTVLLGKVFGLPAHLCVRGLFAGSALFSFTVSALATTGLTNNDPNSNMNNANDIQPVPKMTTRSVSITQHSNYAQPLLRIIALTVGWSLTLSVSTYSLLASRFMNYAQPQLSATFSAGAAMAIITQIAIFPRLVKSVGEYFTCTLGLWAVSLGLVGSSIVRIQPFHSMLYLLNRMGGGLSDTSTATLVARFSNNSEDRARNLGLIQSTHAAARIVTPLISGSLFANSCYVITTLSKNGRGALCPPPGSAPYLLVAFFAFILTPLPLVLKRIQSNEAQSDYE